jgi:transcription antitermination factor NusG
VPILPPEPMIYPDYLLDDPSPDTRRAERPITTPLYPVDDDRARWFVAHTRPRQEKALARYLFARKIAYFAPQYTRPQTPDRRAPKSRLPLFAGYLFIKTDDAGRAEALQSNRIAAPLDVADQARLIDDLRRVRRLVDTQLPLYPEERLQPGKPVRIVYGPLAGLEGLIAGRSGTHRFIVAVDFIQQGVSVQVDARAVEPIDGTPHPPPTTPPRPLAGGMRHAITV